MPNPVKPCAGSFSPATIEILKSNVGHAQWLPQTCELCGQLVGARLEKGLWAPEPHWPSVPRRKRIRVPAVEPDLKTEGSQDAVQASAEKQDK